MDRHHQRVSPSLRKYARFRHHLQTAKARRRSLLIAIIEERVKPEESHGEGLVALLVFLPFHIVRHLGVPLGVATSWR